MSLSQTDSLIQAVLDGDASAAQRAQLDRLITSDAALRAKFETMRHACAVLDALPEIDPPGNMIESVLRRAKLGGSLQAASCRPLSSEGIANPDIGPERRRPDGNWFSLLVHLLKENGMNEQKTGFLGTTRGRLLAIAGVAAVAIAGLSTVIDFPPGGSTTFGTIVPAERHRAPQNSADDIKVGSPASASNQAGPAMTSNAGTAAGSAAGNAAMVAAGGAAGNAGMVAAVNAAGGAAGDAAMVAAGNAAGGAAAKAAMVAAGNAAASAAHNAAANAAASAAASAAGKANVMKQ